MTLEGTGKYRSVFSARSRNPDMRGVVQDGGTVTALLCHLLEAGEIDGAVVTRKADEKWTAGQLVATTKEEILQSSGSVYSLSPSVFQLKEAVRELALEKLAYVGLPCQAVAVRKMQLYPFGGRYTGDKIKVLIGIFCSENFHPEGLRNIVEGYAGVPIKDASKMHITGGRFFVEGNKPGSVPVKKASKWAQDGDHVCPDLTAEYADISVGSIGSDPGWNTVLVRTKNGQKLFEAARSAGAVEVNETKPDPKGLKLLEKLAVAKKAMAKENIESRKKLGIFVTENMYY